MNRNDDDDEGKKLAAAATAAAAAAAVSTPTGSAIAAFVVAVAPGVALVLVAGGVGFGIYAWCTAEDGYELHRAAQSGNIAEVRKLLARNVDINRQNNDGMTPISLACRGAHAPVVEALGNRYADPNIPDNHGDAALIFAIRSRSFETVRRLVEHTHPNLAQRSSDHRLPREIAIEVSDTIAQYLAEQEQGLRNQLNMPVAPQAAQGEEQAAPAAAEHPQVDRHEARAREHRHEHRDHPYAH